MTEHMKFMIKNVQFVIHRVSKLTKLYSISLINVYHIASFSMEIIFAFSWAYCTVRNFGGEKTLVNLVNQNNLPTFCQFSFAHAVTWGEVCTATAWVSLASPISHSHESSSSIIKFIFIFVIAMDHVFHIEPWDSHPTKGNTLWLHF